MYYITNSKRFIFIHASNVIYIVYNTRHSFHSSLIHCNRSMQNTIFILHRIIPPPLSFCNRCIKVVHINHSIFFIIINRITIERFYNS